MTLPEDVSHRLDIARVPTLIPGFDDLLCGGLLSGGLYLIHGPPGAGKTILASQIVYSHAARGARALFLTVLGENHGRMMGHLRAMSFFDERAVPDYVAYISASDSLEDDGLKGLSTLIRREVVAHGASLLVLDGMSAVQSHAEAQSGGLKRFTHELQTLASATDCTMLLITTASGELKSEAEHTMVDGVIELKNRTRVPRVERRVIVHKFRGSRSLEGEHAYAIDRSGITIFPRVEAQYAMPTRRDPPSNTSLSSGVASLDAMLGGGIPSSTITGLVGPSGAGRTTVGLHFINNSSPEEPGLLFGTYEPPERLRSNASTIGLDLTTGEARGDIELLWYPVGERSLDELGQSLLAAVRRRGVKRLFIDGVSGFQQAALEPERIVRFWSALANELRALGVTTLYTLELEEIAGSDIRVPVTGIAALSEVLVLLRYVEVRSRLYRLISLFKVRERPFDPTIREFTITGNGIAVGNRFEGVEAVLSGMARDARRSDAELFPHAEAQSGAHE